MNPPFKHSTEKETSQSWKKRMLFQHRIVLFLEKLPCLKGGILGRVLIISALIFLFGCATPYSLYTDERDIGTQASDKSVATDIKTRLMGQKINEGWEISVYCFRGVVYLLGEIPTEAQRNWAIKLAKKTEGVQEVITHWYTQPEYAGDTGARMKLAVNLAWASKLNSTQISTQVHAGEAVLLGIVSDQGTINRIIWIAKNTPGISKVTSYLRY